MYQVCESYGTNSVRYSSRSDTTSRNAFAISHNRHSIAARKVVQVFTALPELRTEVVQVCYIVYFVCVALGPHSQFLNFALQVTWIKYLLSLQVGTFLASTIC